MNKKVLLMGFAAATFFANSQQTIYSANDAASFGTWTFVDADADMNNWAVQDQSSVQGLESQGDLLTSFSLNPSNFNPLTPNNFASSTPINTAGYENLSLRFNRLSAGAPNAQSEKYSVYVISAASQAALATALVTATPQFTETIVTGRELVEQTIDLSALDGMNNLYIVFRHYDCTGQYFLAIDDVVLEGDNVSASISNLNASNMKVYPQPMTNSMTISNSENIASVSITDQSGRVVFVTNNVASTSVDITTEEFSNGVYFLKVVGVSGTISTQKCIK